MGAERGFTLLEVMVALVIVSLGLLAAFGQINQSATTAIHLRDKTFATWIASDRLAELRLLNEFPAIGRRSEEIEMARNEWRYTIVVSKTAVDSLRRVDVEVALAERPESILTTVSGFVARPSAAATGPGSRSNWAPIGAEVPGG